jgi:hypothetical protein
VGDVRGIHIPAAASPFDGASWITTVSLSFVSLCIAFCALLFFGSVSLVCDLQRAE